MSINTPLAKDQLFKQLEYIAKQAEELGKTIAGKSFTIDTLTIFTQSREEWEGLVRDIKAMGQLSPKSHGKTLYIEPTSLKIAGHSIKYLGLREPDPTRPEVGYADYPVNNFAELQKQAANNPYMAPVISGRGQALIEFKHPDFDVRAYAVTASEH